MNASHQNQLNISATRQRVTGEITPVSAEQSATHNNYETRYGAGNAIDLDLDTFSITVAGTDGTLWLKINLDKVNCVETVIWYRKDGAFFLTWTCTKDDCSNCEGDHCDKYTLTVSTDKEVSDLSPVSDCRYGDTVKLERNSGSNFVVRELAVIEKQGKSVCCGMFENIKFYVTRY